MRSSNLPFLIYIIYNKLSYQTDFLLIIDGPYSSYSDLEIHNGWKTPKDARIPPPKKVEENFSCRKCSLDLGPSSLIKYRDLFIDSFILCKLTPPPATITDCFTASICSGSKFIRVSRSKTGTVISWVFNKANHSDPNFISFSFVTIRPSGKVKFYACWGYSVSELLCRVI